MVKDQRFLTFFCKCTFNRSHQGWYSATLLLPNPPPPHEIALKIKILMLTCSWVQSITLSVIEKSELLDSFEQNDSLSLRREVVLFKLLSQLFVGHHTEYKLRETLQTRGRGGGRGVASMKGSRCGRLEALVEVSVNEFFKDFHLAHRTGNWKNIELHVNSL